MTESEDKKFSFKLKQNSEVVLEPSLTTSILDTKDELSLSYNQKKFEKIIFLYFF